MRSTGRRLIRNVFATAGGQPMYRSYGTRAVGVAELGEVVIELTPFEVHGFSCGSSEATAYLRGAIGPISRCRAAIVRLSKRRRVRSIFAVHEPELQRPESGLQPAAR